MGPHSSSVDTLNRNAWFVYVLKCRNNYLYIGITNNLAKRLREHTRGTGSKFVRSHRPFELIKTIPCENDQEARRLECSLKRFKRDKKIASLGIEVEPVPQKMLPKSKK